MSPSVESPSRVSFGLFEADLQTGELWKAGHRIKLQSQPFKVLSILIEHAGEIVSREELQLRLWGKDTVVDFDHSLGTAINKIREALSDSADNPRFIETLARRGYRFIAPVSVLAPPPTTAAPVPLAVTGDSTETPPPIPSMATATVEPHSIPAMPPRASLLKPAAIRCGVTALAAGAGFYLGRDRTPTEPPRITQLTHNGRISPGAPAMEKKPSSATDGVRIFTGIIENGRTILSQVSLSSGDTVPLPVPSEIAAPSLGDLSPDGSKVLVRSHL